MAQVLLDFKIVDAVPSAYNPNTIYIVKESGSNKARLYKSSLNGDALFSIGDGDDVIKNIIYFGSSAPVDKYYKFWYNDTDLVFLINAGTPGADLWIEAAAMPENISFGGNGVENTASRSDHYHTSVYTVNPSW